MDTPAETPRAIPHAPARRRWRWPHLTIDLSRTAHRRNLLLLVGALTLLGAGAAYGTLKGYEYTESSEFCGETCHVMAPQYMRYEDSAHANVECAHCHIGPGASFFIKSKVDGLRQVYAVMADSYDRPIKSPVHNLRPARETCETCHTPTSFKDNIIKTIVHFDNDEANTRVQSTLILKMGGWQESLGVSQGIHWHITNPVYYIAADAQRQVMLWVGVEQPDGSLKEFFSRDILMMDRAAFVEAARANNEVRELDCIDCHNRAAHQVPPPDVAVDDSIDLGRISTDLPFIRAKAIDVLTPAYATEAEALAAIDGLSDFYRESYPEVYAAQRAELDTALAVLKEIYRGTNFPDMGVNWMTNPNNERHTPFAGCFRCHDDKHVSVDEAGNEQAVISVACNLCHSVPIVGRGDDLLVEAPVIVGAVPDSHADFRWTIEHRSITAAEQQECYQCHGQGFCNNGACHNLSHPPDMLYTHAEEYRK
jgi:nitrate/TMAO reductase-like tetraheme cytochrome c subunit